MKTVLRSSRALLGISALAAACALFACAGGAPKESGDAPKAAPDAAAAPAAEAQAKAALPDKPLPIDAYDYASDELIAAEWKPMNADSRAPRMGNDAEQQVAVFDANFTTLTDWRLYWDRAVKLNLAGYDRLVFEARVEDPEALSGVMMYLESGDGWYALPTFGLTNAWKSVEIWLERATTEGVPLGLDQVKNIRFCLLPGAKKDSRVFVRDLRAVAGLGLDDIGRFSSYKDYASAVADLEAKAKGHANEADALDRLERAKKIHDEVAAMPDVRAPEAQEKIPVAKRYMTEAYALLQETKSPEWRGIWCHYGNGPLKIGEGHKPWRSALKELAADGYTAILPNVLWSGVAYYPSKLVPPSAYVDTEGDQMKAILAAAKENNMEVHAWKVMFQFAEGWMSPSNSPEKFRAEGRMQITATGDTTTWLTPALDENVEFEIQAIEELISNYDVQGIHLDYIRFGGQNVDFSSHMRKKFEERIGKPIEKWPEDVLSGELKEEYNKFRCDLITNVMRTVYKRVKAIKPDIVVSAAVFGKPDFARDNVFQDWEAWAKEGIVDAVFPMSYTSDVEDFRGQIRQHKQALEGTNVKLYVGIGPVLSAWQTLDLDVQADEIRATRELGADGFAMFEAQEYYMKKDLPFLAAGMARKDDGNRIRLPETENLVAMGKPTVGTPGSLLPQKKVLTIADFESSWDKNNVGGGVFHYLDASRVGTKIGDNPWTTHSGAPAELGKHGVVIDGHMGISNPPRHAWTAFCTNLAPDWSPVDIRPYRAVRFWAKGEGTKFNLAVRRKVVSDYANFKAIFTVPAEWTQIEIPFDKFGQPAWGKQEEKSFMDVTDICFAPEMQEGKDFRMELDNIEFVE